MKITDIILDEHLHAFEVMDELKTYKPLNWWEIKRRESIRYWSGRERAFRDLLNKVQDLPIVKRDTGFLKTGEINDLLFKRKEQGISRDDISDGYHTFGELYHHRMVLTKALSDCYPDAAWKSKLHHDGTMFDGHFIIGFSTPEGQYSYHYELEHWDLFDVKVLTTAPEYDGHKPSDIGRLLSLKGAKTSED